MKNTVLVISLLSISLMLSACHTTRGVGQDVEATGEAIQRAAS